jgi:hypothetical protein
VQSNNRSSSIISIIHGALVFIIFPIPIAILFITIGAINIYPFDYIESPLAILSSPSSKVIKVLAV